uniref:Variant surface glycoprotein 324 n=1 Tax=Trypanosoma brucei TaxID=5691 RepID=M4SXV0_9TRYP|nr:variant surface glycoprotein 324 [Trypanosoma brucei]
MLLSSARSTQQRNMAAIAFILTLRVDKAAGNVAAGNNKGEHAALCEFIAMAQQEVEAPHLESLDVEAYRRVHLLNLTLSDDDWINKFYTDKTRKTTKVSSAEAGLDDKGGKLHWDNWKWAAERLTAQPEDTKLKETGAMQLSGLAKKMAGVAIKGIAAKAAKLKDSFPEEALPADASKQAATAAAKKLRDAAFGGVDTALSTLTQATTFGGTPANNRDVECKTQGPGKGTHTALAALACVCWQGNTNTVTHGVCNKAMEGQTGWNGNSNKPGTSDLIKLAKSCGPAGKRKVTAPRLRKAITSLRNLITGHDIGNHYLGTFITGGCSGSSDSGVCIEFTILASGTEDPLSKLPWIAKVEAAAAELEKLTQVSPKAQAINIQLAAAETEANQAVKRAAAEAEEIRKGNNNPTVATPALRKTICEAHNKSKTECLGAQCKWGGKKDDDGPCIVDESKVAEQTTQAGAGEKKDGAASTGCAKHGTKAECDADKKVDKQNCAWRKGKDNEPEPEKEMCRNGSFLVTKQLALMVSAFVALLF